jgi:hypothetical protein
MEMLLPPIRRNRLMNWVLRPWHLSMMLLKEIQGSWGFELWNQELSVEDSAQRIVSTGAGGALPALYTVKSKPWCVLWSSS